MLLLSTCEDRLAPTSWSKRQTTMAVLENLHENFLSFFMLTLKLFFSKHIFLFFFSLISTALIHFEISFTHRTSKGTGTTSTSLRLPTGAACRGSLFYLAVKTTITREKRKNPWTRNFCSLCLWNARERKRKRRESYSDLMENWWRHIYRDLKKENFLSLSFSHSSLHSLPCHLTASPLSFHLLSRFCILNFNTEKSLRKVENLSWRLLTRALKFWLSFHLPSKQM